MHVPPHSRCLEALPLIEQGAALLGFALTAQQIDRFAAYCRLLMTANARMNLTALRTPDAMMRGLFLDSLTLLAALPDATIFAHGAGTSLVDVGSGAGIPGVPLKIALPGLELTCVESIRKKASFLTEATATLSLDYVQIATARAEALARKPTFRDRADVCVARAVARLPALIELCAPFVKPHGVLIFPKSGNVTEEVQSAEDAARALGVQLIREIAVPEVLNLGSGRVTLVYRKLDATPGAFPRRVGLATKEPIGLRRSRPLTG